MAAQTGQAKVLRIGIILEGKIVQERLIKAGEPVTVGESANNTFVFPNTPLAAEYELFHWTGDSYQLRFTKEMKGKIISGGAVVGLENVRKDPAVQRDGDIWILSLTEKDKGKLSVAGVTVLFQFVAPPPVQAVKPIQAMDFRPRIIEEDDPVFLGFLAVWAALGVVFVIWVQNTEPVEIKSLDELPERFTKLVLAPPEQKDPSDQPDTTLEDASRTKADRKKEEEKPSDEPKEAKAKAAPGSQEAKVEEARRREDLRQEVIQESKLLTRLIGTTGRNARGVVDSLHSDGDAQFGDLDERLRASGGDADVEVLSGSSVRGGSGGAGTGDRDIGSLDGVTGGSTGGLDGGAPEVTVQARVDVEDPTIQGEGGDVAEVKRQVKVRYAGQLKYCYESRLKVNPALQGRIVVDWVVEAGAVNSLFISSNTTGDSEFAQCIERKVARWKFGAVEYAEVQFPFVFKPDQ